MANADRIIELLHEAKSRPAGAERERFLTEACMDDAALKEQILSLLEADADEGKSDFLKINQILRPQLPPTEKPGDRIGRYKLLEQIGEGGCGMVYMAEQEEPVRRRVALKVIKLGMDTKQVIARFEAERQALALMDHPNIAKVLEAGATEMGRPFFVMELVRGIKITDYCDQNNLSTTERLELFIQVCQAIQHAHQKGIIHRDIKPSNILVTQHDDVAVPKVIDFGIAKATVGQLTDKTVFTAFAQFIGTPAYMSPEQAQMSGLDIDTRADIYSLGVLLYELLTGHTPFDAKELLAAGLDEMRRKIREDEPAKPSTCLSTMQAMDLTTVARRRHAEPPKLIHLIRGDLDWLVMKCLEKDRTRRYETANGLAADIQRHLSNEPITARPPSHWYEFQKTVRRHKFGFAAATALILVLGLGVLASTWQAIRATHAEREQIRLRKEADAGRKTAQTEAAKSQQVARFMQDMLKGVGPSAALGRDTTMLREILDKTAERIAGDLKDQPLVEAELRNSIGTVYWELGDWYKSWAMHSQALALQRKLLGNEHPSVATTLLCLGGALRFQQKLAESEAAYRESLTMRRKLLGNEHPDVAQSLNDLASLLSIELRNDEPKVLLGEALAIRRKLYGNEHRAVAESLDNLAHVLNRHGQAAEAIAMHREALAIRRKVLGDTHPELIYSYRNLAGALQGQGQLAEAETMLRDALSVCQKLLGDRHPDLPAIRSELGSLLREQGKLKEAEALQTQVDAASQTIAASMQEAGDYLQRRGWLAEAERNYRESLAIKQKFFGDHREVAITLASLGLVLQQQRKWSEAEALTREALAMRHKFLGSDHPEVANSLKQLWELLVAQGKAVELEVLLQELPGEEHSAPESAQAQFGHFLWQVGNAYMQHQQFKDAEQAYEKALQKFKHLQVQIPANAFYRQEQAFGLRLLSDARQRTGRLAEAEAHLRSAGDIYTQLAKEVPTSTFYPQEVAFTRGRIAEVLVAQGKWSEAEAMCRDELAAMKKAFGDVHRGVEVVLVSLGRVLQRAGKLDEAEAVWREELAVERKLSGDEHLFVANSLTSLAAVLYDADKLVEAEALFREALAMRRKFGAEPATVDQSLGWVTSVLEEQGKLVEVETVYREQLATRRKLFGNEHPDVATALATLARTLLAQQKFTEAEPPARECLSIRETKLRDDWRTFNARSMLGGSLLGQKKYGESEPLLLSAYEGMKQREDKIPSSGKPRLKETLQRLVQLYTATTQPEKAAEWNKKFAEFDAVAAEKKTAAPKQ